MRKHLDAIEMDKTSCAVVITGSGDKIFSAGADLSSGFGDFSAVDFLKRGQDVWNKVEYFPKPVIAAINGHALGGGCELAMACHFRFMKKGARIGLTETNLGIMPGYGGSLRLPRLVGQVQGAGNDVPGQAGARPTRPWRSASSTTSARKERSWTTRSTWRTSSPSGRRSPSRRSRSSCTCSPSMSPEHAPEDRAGRAGKALHHQGHAGRHDRLFAEERAGIQGRINDIKGFRSI